MNATKTKVLSIAEFMKLDQPEQDRRSDAFTANRIRSSAWNDGAMQAVTIMTAELIGKVPQEVLEAARAAAQKIIADQFVEMVARVPLPYDESSDVELEG